MSLRIILTLFCCAALIPLRIAPVPFVLFKIVGLERAGSSSLLQGHPSSLRFGHPDVATDNTGPFSTRISHEPVCSSLLQGNPPSLRSGTLMSLQSILALVVRS